MASPSVFEFARDLQRARGFHELFEITLAEVRRATGYQTIWFAIRENEDAEHVRVIDAVGAHRDWFYGVYDENQLIPIAGDKMLEEIFQGTKIVVVEDARTDPRTNKAIVEALRNVTLINVPLALIDKPFGVLGTGTFTPEGPRPPTPEMLAYFESIASVISVAASRLRLEEYNRKVERERRETEQRLARLQRLDGIGVLASGVAHDFNNLLTVVSASSQLARRATTKEEVDLELAAIDEVVERGVALTRQLLAVSRSQTLTLQDVEVSSLLADVLPLLRRVIPESIEIERTDAVAGAAVEADRRQLDQVIINLCLNARDAMPDGGRLTIATDVVVLDETLAQARGVSQPGRYVSLTIRDTGHGITQEHLDRIFEPFFTTKGERKGTGLGLSVAQGIVRQHGGVIFCESTVGVGTVFEVLLPALARDVRAFGIELPARIRGGDERILVADDDDAVRRVVTRVLEGAGYSVRAVSSGRDVIRALEADAFELLLFDTVMPGIPSGEMAARAIGLRPELRVLPFAKPYDSDALLRAVRAVLDRVAPAT